VDISTRFHPARRCRKRSIARSRLARS
jgi:hypothetical protein